MKLALGRDADRFLLLLLAADGACLVLHLVHSYTGALDNRCFSIALDMGYAEVLQYLKEFWIVVLLCVLGRQRSGLLYMSFALLFGYFLIDDSLQVHERLGSFLAKTFDFSPAFGLRARDFGELIVSMSFGTLFFVLIGISYALSDAQARTVAQSLCVLVAVLALFGVLVDMLHVVIAQEARAPLLDFIEDGGEMCSMSVIVWFVFRLNYGHAAPQAAVDSPALWDTGGVRRFHIGPQLPPSRPVAEGQGSDASQSTIMRKEQT